MYVNLFIYHLIKNSRKKKKFFNRVDFHLHHWAQETLHIFTNK